MRTLALEPMHGWAIAQRIQQVSNDLLRVQQGSLYPALHRLEKRRRLRAEWAASETGREARFYSLTKLGRQQLEEQRANWDRLSAAISGILSATE
jgi:transcriptional regulator